MATLYPHLHQLIAKLLAEGQLKPLIIRELLTKHNVSISDGKELVNLVVRMNEAVNGSFNNPNAFANAIASPSSDKSPISLVNPRIKELADGSNTVLIEDRLINIRLRMSDPEVILIDNLLSPQECDHLISVASQSLSRSTVAVFTKGTSEESSYRTSFNTSLNHHQDDVVKNIEDRISTLFNWDNRDTDLMQILRYELGEYYKPHYDYFNDGSSFVKGVGERVATLILYLDEPQKGGTTYFPDLKTHVGCRKGSALFFAYPTPTPDSKTLHSGEPVIEGTKWIATKWFRSLDKQI